MGSENKGTAQPAQEFISDDEFVSDVDDDREDAKGSGDNGDEEDEEASKCDPKNMLPISVRVFDPETCAADAEWVKGLVPVPVAMSVSQEMKGVYGDAPNYADAEGAEIDALLEGDAIVDDDHVEMYRFSYSPVCTSRA